MRMTGSVAKVNQQEEELTKIELGSQVQKITIDKRNSTNTQDSKHGRWREKMGEGFVMQ